ncbi:hypothetical protein LTR62_004062 [Meristemomyces frigidus]|uniref:Actin-like protein ARP6 n=1 Tax=Meristemomyces frigidus TaxID=1508187 RepID=A0AAN7TNN2_9PEZI|nr:hypothetical protein LTR62_004062 [Meristemomyces frigidus]
MARQKSLPSAPEASGHLADKTLIIDNGAHTLKAGLATHLDDTPPNLDSCHIIPNVIARSQRDKRTYIGPEYSDCLDFGELAYRRPVEKGFIVHWEAEKAVWERSFLHKDDAVVKCDPEETSLILTEAPNAPVALQRNADEMVFEEFGFAGYYRTIAPTLNAYAPSPFPSTATSVSGVPLECLLIIDVGHSHTTVTPLHHGRPFQHAIKRLEIGGKTLTNQMKLLISRTFDVHREDHIVSEIKEDVCFVSQDFNADLERVWRGGRYDPRAVDASLLVDYVLPDYETIKRGYARPHDPAVKLRDIMLGIGTEGGRREHVLTIANERFVVPELLFSPADIGMRQAGLAGMVLQSIDALPAGFRQAYLANILVVGGTSKLPGFVQRLESELRSLVDVDEVVRVARAEEPAKNVWLGGAGMAKSADLMRSLIVTRQEYAEHGDGWARRVFAGKARR